MRQRLRKVPSPALVIASIALVLALGGTSIAAVSQLPRASVGAPQLKAGAVTTAKIRNNDVRSLDVRNGSLLRVDFRAGQIPAGPAGPAGPQGAPGVSAREQVNAESAQNSLPSKNVTVTCPAGKKVLGGGVELSGPGRNRVSATENQPFGENGWEAEAFEVVSTPAAWKVIVHAICANVS
jgi:hypothetical protein